MVKVTRRCPQTTTFLKRLRRAEAVSNRGPSAYQPNALPLGQTGSHILISCSKSNMVSVLNVHWETIRLIRDGENGGRGYGGGGGGSVYVYIPITTRSPPEWPALRWAAMRAVFSNVSLIVRDKVTRPCPQTTTFEESRSGIEPRSFRLPTYRLTARPNWLSLISCKLMIAYIALFSARLSTHCARMWF